MNDILPNTHIGLFIYDFMGFNCFSEVDLRISYYVETYHLSDSLVKNQILSESGLVR